MKKLYFIAFIVFLSKISFAQQTHAGAGIILGDPTGLSAKFWLNDENAIDAAAAWSLDDGALLLHADYLIHNFRLIAVDEGELPFYYGIGGKIVMANDVILGARIPVGLSYLFVDLPLDAFFEIVPVLQLIPATDFNLDAAIGVRYYF